LNKPRIGNKLLKKEKAFSWQVFLFLDEEKSLLFLSGVISFFHRGGGVGEFSIHCDLSVSSR
jgi:hypothetical protein